jgi:hypothetical protein
MYFVGLLLGGIYDLINYDSFFGFNQSDLIDGIFTIALGSFCLLEAESQPPANLTVLVAKVFYGVKLLAYLCLIVAAGFAGVIVEQIIVWVIAGNQNDWGSLFPFVSICGVMVGLAAGIFYQLRKVSRIYSAGSSLVGEGDNISDEEILSYLTAEPISLKDLAAKMGIINSEKAMFLALHLQVLAQSQKVNVTGHWLGKLYSLREVTNRVS